VNVPPAQVGSLVICFAYLSEELEQLEKPSAVWPGCVPVTVPRCQCPDERGGNSGSLSLVRLHPHLRN
jgi:hypothetical protein